MFFEEIGHEPREVGFNYFRLNHPQLKENSCFDISLYDSEVLSEDVADMIHRLASHASKTRELATLIQENSIPELVRESQPPEAEIMKFNDISKIESPSARLLCALFFAAPVLERMQIADSSLVDNIIDRFLSREPSALFFALTSLLVKISSRNLKRERFLQIIDRILSLHKGNPTSSYLTALGVYAAYHTPGNRREIDSLPFDEKVVQMLLPLLTNERVELEITLSNKCIVAYGSALETPLFVAENPEKRELWERVRRVGQAHLDRLYPRR